MALSQLFEVAEITPEAVTAVDDLEDFDPVFRKSDKFSILNRLAEVHELEKQQMNPATIARLFE